MRKPLELYIHIPFCIRKCAYCDFLSFPSTEKDAHEYVGHLLEEIDAQSAHYRDDYEVVSVFIGGGTPSYLRGEDIGDIMATIQDCFYMDIDPEVTIEINPGTVLPDKLNCYARAGINRISIGCQSADDEELRTLGRIHTFDDFLKTYERVRKEGFTNVNVDLMSGLPGQTLDSWKNTLRHVAMLRPEHISAYSLIIEEGTPFYERYHDHPELLPDEDTEREMYYATKSILAQSGYSRYEISNYSKPGYECRHNIGYWTGTEYVGMGLGSSSYVYGYRFKNISDIDEYLKIHMDSSDADEKIHTEIEQLTLKDRIEEFMFLGLRMMKGVSGGDFEDRFGLNMWDVYGEVIDNLQKNNLLEVDKPEIRLTDFGIDVSNYVLSEFLLD